MATNNNYDDLFDFYGQRFNVDPALTKTLFHVETNGNPKSPDSSQGAEGGMQLEPATAASLGIADSRDMNQAIFAATKYVRQGLDQTGTPIGAAAYYHGGPNTNQWGPKTAAYAQKAASVYPTMTITAKRPSQSAEPSEADIDAELMRAPTVSPQSAEPMSEADIDRQLMGVAPSGPPTPGQIDPLTGKTAQFVSSAQGPVAASLGRDIQENMEPVAAQVPINLSTDPEQRRRIAAAQIFPGMSSLEAQSRVFYGTNNRLAAVSPGGQPYYVDPVAPSVSGRTIGNPLAYAASGAGGALPVAGGIAGGLAGGPTSLVLGPSLAAAGAATGDLARQYGARYFDPSATPPPIDLSQTAKQAALSGAGAFGGGVVSNALAPNVLRVTPGEINILRANPVMNDTRAAYDRAAAQGINLTPGQATGLPSLLQYEDAATTMPQSVDQATGFYRQQGRQIANAGQNMLQAISPNADKTDAALMFQQGAQDATRAVRTQANAAARPAYQTAESAGNIMTPDLAQMMDAPAIKTAMDKAATTYQNLYGRAPPDTPDFAMWDLTKRQLDSAHGVAQRAGENTDAMAIDNLRQRLLGNLDTSYPTYGQARAIAAPGQRLASQLEDSGVGSTAGSGIDERARAIVAPVFNQNPRAIAQARDAFEQAGRSDEWNAGVRSYIQDAFDKASMSQQGLNPAMLRRQVWGNVDNRDSIQAALSPAQYQGFDNFMRTIEDTARTYPMNSLTATRGNARGALQSASEGQPNVRALDTGAALLSPFQWGNIGNRVLSGTRNRMVQSNMQQIVGHLFSPDGMQYLEAMSRYSPGSQRAIQATSQVMTRLAPKMLSGPSTNDNNPLQTQPASPLQSATGQ